MFGQSKSLPGFRVVTSPDGRCWEEKTTRTNRLEFRLRLIEFRSMKNFNLPDFLAELKRVPWSSSYTFDNADDVWNKRSKADFTIGNIYNSTNISEDRAFLLQGLTYDDEVKLRRCYLK